MEDKTRKAVCTNESAVGGVQTAQGSIGDPCVCYVPQVETIEVEQVLGAEMRQKVVEFDMCVPSRKPNIEQVVDVYVKNVSVDTIDVIYGRVILRGCLDVKVMYVADLPKQPVHAFERSGIRFTRDIDVAGAHPGMEACSDVTVEYVDYDFNCCDPRKVHVTIVLKFWVRVTTTGEMDVMAMTPVDTMGVINAPAASMSSGSFVAASGFDEQYTSTPSYQAGDYQSYPPQATYAPSEENVTEVVPLVPSTGETETVKSAVGIINGTNVNVRTGPGTNYPSVTKLDKGTEVTLKDQAFGWYKVILPDNATTGWVAGWLVDGNLRRAR